MAKRLKQRAFCKLFCYQINAAFPSLMQRRYRFGDVLNHVTTAEIAGIVGIVGMFMAHVPMVSAAEIATENAEIAAEDDCESFWDCGTPKFAPKSDDSPIKPPNIKSIGDPTRTPQIEVKDLKTTIPNKR